MNKHIGDFTHHCAPQDNDCWRRQFEGIIKCKTEDPECWRKRLPELPCYIDDIKCWKQQIPDFPCEFTDFQCLKNRLPPLPCKMLDTVCWERYIKNRNEDGTGKTDEGVVPRAHQRPLNWMYQVDGGHRTFDS